MYGRAERLPVECRRPEALALGDRLSVAVAAFEADPELPLVAVVDDAGRPIGAIFERDVRRIMFHPYGHALLENPSYDGRLADRLRPCPVADADSDIASLLDAYAAADGRDGMVLTRDGRYLGVLPAPAMLTIAAAQEAERARVREKRLARIEENGARFHAEAAELARAMIAVAGTVQSMSDGAADRAGIAGQRAQSTAAAAAQTADGIAAVARRGRQLAGTLDDITRHAATARDTRTAAMRFVASASEQSRTLSISADEIGSVAALISTISSRVNMLAINATIEAARAGEAGRGFAVVATEVKGLAGQARDASRAIAERLDGVRAVLGAVSENQSGIARSFGAIEAASDAIERAVCEESLALTEIAASTEQAVHACAEIRDNVADIDRTVGGARSSALALRAAAGDIARRADTLGDRVERFVADMRAA